MPVHGDLGQLRDLSRKLRLIADGKVIAKTAERLPTAIMKAAADQFRSESDPYGVQWAPLKRERARNKKARKKGKKGGQKIGQNNGHMRGSLTVRAEGNRVTAAYGMHYAVFFSDGTRFQVPRHLLPVTTRGLGPKWDAMVRREMKAALDEVMGGP